MVLADRDVRIKDLASLFLGRAGHKVTCVADGVEALDAVRRLRPDVLITEILLPKLDGLALCRRIKADGELAGTHVLVFSILAAGTRAREAGADAFLSKPFAPARLDAALAQLLDRAL